MSSSKSLFSKFDHDYDVSETKTDLTSFSQKPSGGLDSQSLSPFDYDSAECFPSESSQPAASKKVNKKPVNKSADETSKKANVETKISLKKT